MKNTFKKNVFKTMFIVTVGVIFLASHSSASANDEAVPRSRYLSVSGEIKQISKYENTGFVSLDGQTLILVEGEDGKIMNFRITADTYMLTDEAPEIGKNAIGFYDATMPAIMIYPPQMAADVFAVSPDESVSIKADFFDENLVSSDNTLKLNVSDTTEIFSADGSVYDGEIKNKSLAVLYDITTRSIPAQTAPKKVIVLPEKETAESTPPEQIPSVENSVIQDTERIPVTVNGKKESAHAFAKSGVVMVPVRSICELIGYEVSWDPSEKSITVDDRFSFKIDSDFYTTKTTSNVLGLTLYAAPVLIDSVTYVPLEFFTDVVKLNKAQYSDGVVTIEGGQ